MSKVVKALPEKKKTCPVCGKEFNAYGRQIYCGVQCRNKEMARRANPELKRRAEKTPKGSSPEDPVKDCPKDCRYLGKGTRMRTCVCLRRRTTSASLEQRSKVAIETRWIISTGTQSSN